MVTQQPITLRDVARAAEVHPSTASRALNVETRPLVNDGTVARVLAAAEALGYEPNSLARGLKLNRTFQVGFVLPDLTNPLFPPMVRGLEDSLNGAKYTVVIANTDNDADKERSVLDAMLRRRVDGLVLATARRHDPAIDGLREAGMPLVLVNRTTEDGGVPSVTGDDHAGIGMALRHLVELGHRRIAYVGAPTSVSTGLARYQAFVSWARSEGIEVDADLMVSADWFQEDPGANAFRELLERDVSFTAVVAANDLIALGCYDVATEQGISVPGEVSIVGYNDMPFADKLSPPLTTVHVPVYEIGRRAADLLLETIDQPTSMADAIRLRPELIVRGSTQPPVS